MTELKDKSLALLVTKGDETMLYKGIMRVEDDLLFFEQEDDDIRFMLLDDWALKIIATPDDLKEMTFESEYLINLTIGEGHDQVPLDKFKKTGLKWNS